MNNFFLLFEAIPTFYVCTYVAKRFVSVILIQALSKYY